MHGPCGLLNDRCPRMKNVFCSKFYPKSFRNETTIDKDGFALYRRPDNGLYIMKGNVHLDNRWVVPRNMFLLKKYCATKLYSISISLISVDAPIHNANYTSCLH